MATMWTKKVFCFQKLRFVFIGNRFLKTNVTGSFYPVRTYSFASRQSSVLFRRRSAFLTVSCSSRLEFTQHLSSGEIEAGTSYIPPPPALPQDPIDAVTSVLSQVEPSLASQGLAGWTPTGLVEQLLEFLHISGGLPWWVSISVATIVARICLFPVFVITQRNAAKLHNVMPQMQVLQLKITEARQNGNAMEVAKYTNELVMFMKEKDCNPLKTSIAPLSQAPIFISFFFALREMANLPVESFKHGGALWFIDLTIPDPYFALPLITCVTLFITIELGAEGGVQIDQLKLARYLLRAIPVIMFPFIINFPGAVLCYWVSTNAVTLLQVGLLKIPGVRPYLKIPARIRHSAESLPPKKGFRDSLKDTMANMKMAREMEGRLQADQIKFRKAGMGAVPKTYKFDPTKQKENKK